jgi:hypothetical protein
MNIYVPGGVFAIIISLYVFYRYNRVMEEKRVERHKRLTTLRQQYVDPLVKEKKEPAFADESGVTPKIA